MTETADVFRERVRSALRSVYDPELGVNIVDLGLLHDIQVEGGAVSVTITLTTPGCPVGPMIEDGVRRAALGLPGVTSAVVNVVWEPRWSPDSMSDDAKRQLGFRD